MASGPSEVPKPGTMKGPLQLNIPPVESIDAIDEQFKSFVMGAQERMLRVRRPDDPMLKDLLQGLEDELKSDAPIRRSAGNDELGSSTSYTNRRGRRTTGGRSATMGLDSDVNSTEVSGGEEDDYDDDDDDVEDELNELMASTSLMSVMDIKGDEGQDICGSDPGEDDLTVHSAAVKEALQRAGVDGDSLLQPRGSPQSLRPRSRNDLGPRELPPPLPLFDFRSDAVDGSSGLLPPKTGTALPCIWPSPKLHHVLPKEPEEFHVAEANLVAKMMMHDADRAANAQNVLNRVVFDAIDSSPSMQASGVKVRPGMANASLPSYYTPSDENDVTLVFESRFEGGNLRRAIQVYEYEYDLILKPDVNTRGHTQWYFFSVKNMRVGRTYKFNVINMVKPDSLYNYGMKPLIYSEKRHKEDGTGWFRDGWDICYYQNSIKRRNGYYYTFSFSYEFKHGSDIVYFAYCTPYSYTDLVQYLDEMEEDPRRKNRFRRRPLCQTLAGNTCELLTITSFACDPEVLRNRKGVVITGRVHPGETNASWMMKGIIDYMTGPSLQAKLLRDNFVFKIVPMLNPDGVINGNYRCSLAGVDLNRQWTDPSKKLHPTIYHTKMMIKRFQEDRDVVLYCDLHGHSRKKNIFIYGCENKNNMSLRLQERIFPRILWKNAKVFSFADCNFKTQRSKESTGRVVVWREFGIINSYTMEASFAGSNFGQRCNQHFTTKDLEEMGHLFCETILDTFDPDRTKVNAVMRELELLYPLRVVDSDSDESSAGSDDDPSADNLEKEAAKLKEEAAKLKKKRKKERRAGGRKSNKEATRRESVRARAERNEKLSAPEKAPQSSNKGVDSARRPSKSGGLPGKSRNTTPAYRLMTGRGSVSVPVSAPVSAQASTGESETTETGGESSAREVSSDNPPRPSSANAASSNSKPRAASKNWFTKLSEKHSEKMQKATSAVASGAVPAYTSTNIVNGGGSVLQRVEQVQTEAQLQAHMQQHFSGPATNPQTQFTEIGRPSLAAAADAPNVGRRHSETPEVVARSRSNPGQIQGRGRNTGQDGSELMLEAMAAPMNRKTNSTPPQEQYGGIVYASQRRASYNPKSESPRLVAAGSGFGVAAASRSQRLTGGDDGTAARLTVAQAAAARRQANQFQPDKSNLVLTIRSQSGNEAFADAGRGRSAGGKSRFRWET